MDSELVSEKTCPFMLNKYGYPRACSKDCMAWTVVQPETSRENHSGGAEMMQGLAAKYNARVDYEGPRNSMGKVICPELGYCKRLWPNADPVTPEDYRSQIMEVIGERKEKTIKDLEDVDKI